MKTLVFRMVALVVLLSLFLAVPVSGAAYAPHDLGTLGGSQSIAYAINGAGVVAGHSNATINGPLHATVWFQGRVTDLGTLGGTTSSAQGVSNNGLVVGRSDTTDHGGLYYHAVLWDHGVMNDLGMLGSGLYSVAYGVNNARQVVGESNHIANTYDYHAFLWQNGTMTDLTPAAARSSAQDINAAGQIVGYSSVPQFPNRFHATLWQGGQTQDLGANFNGKSYALGLNELGQVVGYVDNGIIQRAVTWINGQMSYLPMWSGGYHTRAYAVNNYGQIVGSAETSGHVAHAVLWQDGRIIDLGTLGGRASTAHAINGIGQIAGWSAYTPGTTSPLHATLWLK